MVILSLIKKGFMKKLNFIFFFGLFLAACNNDKPGVIVNLNIMGENSDSIQKLIKEAVNNDSARIVNINIYNNVLVESNNQTSKEESELEWEKLLEECKIDSKNDTVKVVSEWNW